MNYIKEDFKINNSLDVIKEKDKVTRYKVSMVMKKTIDEHFKKLKLLPDDDFIVEGIKILDKNFIKTTYDEINKNTFKSVKARIKKSIR